MTERELLEQIAGGDEAALHRLYTMYYERIGRFLLRLTNDTELVAEVINDVFMVVWRKARLFRGDSSPSTWIMGIAYKRALSALKKRRPSVPLAAVADRLCTEANGDAEDACSAIEKLGPKHRAVVVLTYQFGYSYKEISQLLACPENTVKTRMFHARRALKSLLEASE